MRLFDEIHLMVYAHPYADEMAVSVFCFTRSPKILTVGVKKVRPA